MRGPGDGAIDCSMADPAHRARIAAGSQHHRADGDILHAHDTLRCRQPGASDIAGAAVATAVVGEHVRYRMGHGSVSPCWSRSRIYDIIDAQIEAEKRGGTDYVS